MVSVGERDYLLALDLVVGADTGMIVRAEM